MVDLEPGLTVVPIMATTNTLETLNLSKLFALSEIARLQTRLVAAEADYTDKVRAQIDGKVEATWEYGYVLSCASKRVDALRLEILRAKLIFDRNFPTCTDEDN